jgi:uncharacterized membrane protein required for colicin V production
MIGNFNLLDLILPVLIVGGLLICFQRAFVRTLISVFTLFIAFAIAALLYTAILTWFAKSLGGSGQQNGGSIIFAGLLIVFYVFLEWLVTRNYPGLRIASLKNWDHILGGVVGIVWTALAISLILLTLHYGSLTVGASAVSGLAYLIEQSKVAGLFRAFFVIPLSIVKLLFPNGLPEILKYFVLH